MDFEKIVAIMPFGVTIWRAESKYLGDFRLVYANDTASVVFKDDLYRYIGTTVADSFPDALKASSKNNFPQAWMRVLNSGVPEMKNMPFHGKTAWYDIYIMKLDKNNVASIYKDVTAEKLAIQSEQVAAKKADDAIKALSVVEIELKRYKQLKGSGEYKLGPEIKAFKMPKKNG